MCKTNVDAVAAAPPKHDAWRVPGRRIRGIGQWPPVLGDGDRRQQSCWSPPYWRNSRSSHPQRQRSRWRCRPGFLHRWKQRALIGDVRYWHLADIRGCSAHVCFWGQSGHLADLSQCPLVTRKNRHPKKTWTLVHGEDQSPRFVSGRFVQYGTDGRLAGTALLEMYGGDNRLAIDHGASGAPVFDCEGRVAAVISTVIVQTFSTPFGVRRMSTAWGSPNVVSVPVRTLMEFSEAR